MKREVSSRRSQEGFIYNMVNLYNIVDGTGNLGCRQCYIDIAEAGYRQQYCP